MSCSLGLNDQCQLQCFSLCLKFVLAPVLTNMLVLISVHLTQNPFPSWVAQDHPLGFEGLDRMEKTRNTGKCDFGKAAEYYKSCKPHGSFRPLKQAETELPSHLSVWTTVHLTAPVFQANNDILAFLSGMPVTRNTKYLDLKNSVSGASSFFQCLSVPSQKLHGIRQPLLLLSCPGSLRSGHQGLSYHTDSLSRILNLLAKLQDI